MTGDVLTFTPLLDSRVIAAMGFVGLVLVLINVLRGGAGGVSRFLVLLVLVAALFNPRLVQEQRTAQRDVAVIVVDRTSSLNVGDRQAQVETAVTSLRQQFSAFADMDVREVDVADGHNSGQSDGGTGEGSNLITALNKKIGEIPKGRFAGAVMITDGQIHDVKVGDGASTYDGPVHVLLSGQPDERDRRLVIDNAPSYGIVGQDVSISYHVEDTGGRDKGKPEVSVAQVVLRDGEKIIGRAEIPIGQNDTFTFTMDHAGPSILEIEVAPSEGEVSVVNNRSLLSINGVRDRLRVLLVSGQPHAGERTWRNLLKADPSVDLVHFTILRPPEKDDFTPLNELALISFPTRELFEVKLHEFDLVVFDRYVLRGILPGSYLQNVVDYVNDGGAILMSTGPEFIRKPSLLDTALNKILPAIPTGKIVEQAYRPTLSAIGKRHPVTEGLSSQAPINRDDPSKPGWGHWFRQIDARKRSGTTVLTGLDERPLLVLDRKGQGRVALMLSDHIWLWARGYDGGGPQAELLRRLAHWLMKEPDLEEENLRASVADGQLHIERRSLSNDETQIEVTSPSGKIKRISTRADDNGKFSLPASEVGLYKISDGVRQVLTASGALNPLEFSDLRTTAAPVKPVVDQSGGGIFWIKDGIPDFRRTRPDHVSKGKDWAGLQENRSFSVTGVSQTPVLSGVALMVGLLLLIMSAWWREGR